MKGVKRRSIAKMGEVHVHHSVFTECISGKQRLGEKPPSLPSVKKGKESSHCAINHHEKNTVKKTNIKIHKADDKKGERTCVK